MTEVPGSYEGKYGGLVEVFDLRPDGTFTQTLTRGSEMLYTNNGRWRISGRMIVFDDVFCAIDDTGKVAKEPKVRSVNLSGLWVAGDRGWRCISFNVDADYQIQRTIPSP